MPYEEITAEQYAELAAKLKPLDFRNLQGQEEGMYKFGFIDCVIIRLFALTELMQKESRTNFVNQPHVKCYQLQSNK